MTEIIDGYYEESMTESKAIKDIQHDLKWHSKELKPAYKKSLRFAIQALEEIQAYRAIGTVEDIQKKMEELERWHTDRINENIKNPFAYTSTMICHNCDHKDEYIEELEAEIEEYKSIGTIEEFKDLKEKNVAKKPNEIERKRDEYGFIYQIGKCPCCGKLVTDDRECCDCMQKLDWE